MCVLLICLFGLSPDSVGIKREKEVVVSKQLYERMKYEEGNSAKWELCQKEFGKFPDLGWFEEVGDGAVSGCGQLP